MADFNLVKACNKLETVQYVIGTIFYHGCYNLVNNVVTTMHVTSLYNNHVHKAATRLSPASHFYLHGCVCVYVCTCAHSTFSFYRYLNEPKTDRTLKKTSDVHGRQHIRLHTHVAALARKFLAIISASYASAPSERVFSTTMNIQQRKRWRILPCHLHQVLLLRRNRAILADL